MVPPFELRQFPLPTYLYDLMLQESMQEIAEDERPLLRTRRDSAKNSNEHMNSNDYTHASNGMMASPPITDVEMNDEDLVKGNFYNDHELLSGEKDDPEWKPS